MKVLQQDILLKHFFVLSYFQWTRDYHRNKVNLNLIQNLYSMGHDPLDKHFYNSGAITNATTAINFNKIFKDGPDVSLKGSPTVSPTTVALCGSEPL